MYICMYIYIYFFYVCTYIYIYKSFFNNCFLCLLYIYSSKTDKITLKN